MIRLQYLILLTILNLPPVISYGFAYSYINVDSLHIELRTTQYDSVKVICLNELSWEYTNHNPDSALYYAIKAKSISESIYYRDGISTSLYRIGTINRILGNYDIAIENLNNALQIEIENKNTYGIARINGQLTLLYINIGQISMAHNSAQICVDIYKESNDLYSLANAYDRLSIVHKKQSMFKDALRHVYYSLDIREQLRDTTNILFSYLNLANLYLNLSNPNKSIEYNTKAILIARNNLDYNRLAKAYTNIGNAYYQLKQYDSTIQYNLESIALKKKIKQVRRLDVNYDNIGACYYVMGEYSEAIKFYNMSLELKNANGIKEGLSTIFTNLGDVHFATKKYDKALEFYNKGLQASKYIDNKILRLEIYNSIYNCYLLLNKLNKAVLINNQYIALRDSIDTSFRNVVNLKEDYLNQQKKKQILEKDKLINEIAIKRKNILINSLVIGLILMVLLFFALYKGQKLKQKSILSEKKISELLKDQELKSYSAMLEGQEGERKRIAQDLHDRLGSMLSMVKLHFKSVEDGLQALRESSLTIYTKANDLLDEACEEVRKIANDLNSGVLNNFGLLPALNSLKGSIEATGQLNIEVFEFGFDNRRLEYQMEINIYRIIQELISNILKHSKANEVSIQLLKKERRLNIIIEDNGIGFNPVLVKNKKGMGLRNVESRVSSLRGELNIDSGKGGGTTITIEIPLN